MSTFVETDANGHEVRMREKLASLGAYPAGDGKICDRSGKEIRFWESKGSGVPVTSEAMAAQARELAELQQKFTVIILYRDPREPLPC
jgi:hypothetical protein